MRDIEVTIFLPYLSTSLPARRLPNIKVSAILVKTIEEKLLEIENCCLIKEIE